MLLHLVTLSPCHLVTLSPCQVELMLHAMIMAGGGGTRFWPRSRQARPKQFLTLTGDRSLLQLACDRLEAQVPPENTWVITAEQHRDEAQKQLPHLPPARVVGEPTGRDTAPCIA